jgi:ActR/RegA family two-component response regulator
MSALKGRHILVVEDEALIALDLQRLLDQSGAMVIGPAVSVSQALEVIHENHIDFALLDVKLGDETVDPWRRSANRPFNDLRDCLRRRLPPDSNTPDDREALRGISC